MTEEVPDSAESAKTRGRSLAARLRVGIIAAAAITVGWFLLAVTHPTTTYHFGPILVTIAPVALARLQSTGSLHWRIVLAGVGIGAGLALATTILLESVGALHGPTLLGYIGPVAEALIAILLGVILEAVSTLIRQAWPAR